MLLWSRDEWVFSNIPKKCDDVDMCFEGEGSIKGRWSIPTKAYPPCGIMPFWGISCYAMIVSFLHSSVETAYFTFRELYTRFNTTKL